MRTVAIIQARMGSTRLPGKVLKTLEDRSVLGHVIERLRLVRQIDQIVVATTTMPHDQVIVDEAERYNVPAYRGSEADVLSRYYGAALEHQADQVVRITSDCPLIDPSVVAQIVDLLTSSRADYASNALIRSFPRGLDTEAFTMEALSNAYHKASHPEQREHVTPFIYQNRDLFSIQDYISDVDYSMYRWTLDTPEDWELIEAIYSSLYSPGVHFSWIDAINLMKAKPELAEINAHIEQKRLST